jgi:hypothetical protein
MVDLDSPVNEVKSVGLVCGDRTASAKNQTIYSAGPVNMSIPIPDLDASLQSAIDQFLDDWRQGYVDDASANEVLAAADGLAGMLEAEVLELVGPQGGALWGALRPYLEEQELGGPFRVALQVRMTRHLLPSFDLVADRGWHLAELSLKQQPSMQVRRYLKRATRCYLLNLVPECLVMCRAALESAVNDRFIAQSVAFPRDKHGNVTMRAKLDYAGRHGWLAEAGAEELMQLVWTRGSKAAHQDPDAVGDALGSLALMMRALSGLLPEG